MPIKEVTIIPGDFTTLKVGLTLKSIAAAPFDFTERRMYRLIWDGTTYLLSQSQARAIQELITRTAAGKEHVPTAELLRASESDAESLEHLFNNGTHPALGTVFQLSADGTAELQWPFEEPAEPEDVDPPPADAAKPANQHRPTETS